MPNLLSAGHKSIRSKLIGRYANFFRSLLKSLSEEVALVANMAGMDKFSTTGINLVNIQTETGLNPWTVSPADIRDAISEKEDPVPPSCQTCGEFPFSRNSLNKGTRWRLALKIPEKSSNSSTVSALVESS